MPNALAPDPRNALLARLDADPLQSILRSAATNPSYNDVTDYLMARRSMPRVKTVLGLGSGAEFTTNSFFGNKLPPAGEIRLGLLSDANAATHEMTHAADRQLNEQYYQLSKKNSLTPAEQQFMQAFEKLAAYKPGGTYPRVSMAEKLAPEWAKKHADYRASNKELAGWGMGSTASRNTDYNVPAHLDPTMATEFSILLDMARRIQPVIPGR